jgi:hypothetical protein
MWLIDSFDQVRAKGAIWEYVINDDTRTNMRIGQIIAVWDQVNDSTPVIVGETFGDGIGTTWMVVIFTVDKSLNMVRLQAENVAGNWKVNSIRKFIGVP